MAKSNDKLANDNFRNEVIEKIKELFYTDGEEIMQVKSNKLAFPFVNSEGSDEFIEITVSVPRGSRDKEPYDAYALADEFQAKLEKDSERQAKRDEAKQKKIAQDKKKREIAKKKKTE